MEEYEKECECPVCGKPSDTGNLCSNVCFEADMM